MDYIRLKECLKKGIEILKDVIPEEDFEQNKIRMKNVRFGFNNAKKTLASYHDDENEIVFSIKYLDVASSESITNTMIHELLHLVHPDDGHKGKWREMAEKFNKTHYANEFGAIKRLGNKTKTSGQYKYVLTCKKCGFKIYQHRKSNRFHIDHTTDIGHKHCGGRFTWELSFDYPENKKLLGRL